tara:strand:+ start:1721 stop:2176 length:456 start_codon:yes stop_codon:yes gene_type:complete
MAIKTYTPLISEVLSKVHKAKTKAQKIGILKENDSEAIRMIIKSSFDPKIKWVLPDGAVPYRPNDAPDGTEHTLLSQEAKRLYHFIQGADNVTPRAQKENMYIQMLEGLHRDEAEVLVYAKDKILHQKYKGLSHEVVKTAFGWNSDYIKAS